MHLCPFFFVFFFFNDTATTEIYTLSLHDALPISPCGRCGPLPGRPSSRRCSSTTCGCRDRKSTRLNSSHLVISYAVFCLKKKKKIQISRHSALTTIHVDSSSSSHVVPYPLHLELV